MRAHPPVAGKHTLPQFEIGRRLRHGDDLLGFASAAQATNPSELYGHADTALYHAKETGRNRSVYYEDGMQKNYTGKNWLIYRT